MPILFPRYFEGIPFPMTEVLASQHWFVCRVALGLLVEGLPGYWPPLREGMGFGEGPGRGLPKAAASTVIL